MTQPVAIPIGSSALQSRGPRQDSIDTIIRDLQSRIIALESEMSRIAPAGVIESLSAIPIGSTMLVSITFTDKFGTNFDPITPSIHVIDPGHTEITYVGGSLIHPSIGVYQVEVVVNLPGKWTAKGVATLADGHPVVTPDVSQIVSSTVVP
jgi:hypothetical protein